jgi:hypothetical protein
MNHASRLVIGTLAVVLVLLACSDVVLTWYGKALPDKLMDVCLMIVSGLLGMLAKTEKPEPPATTGEQP